MRTATPSPASNQRGPAKRQVNTRAYTRKEQRTGTPELNDGMPRTLRIGVKPFGSSHRSLTSSRIATTGEDRSGSARAMYSGLVAQETAPQSANTRRRSRSLQFCTSDSASNTGQSCGTRGPSPRSSTLARRRAHHPAQRPHRDRHVESRRRRSAAQERHDPQRQPARRSRRRRPSRHEDPQRQVAIEERQPNLLTRRLRGRGSGVAILRGRSQSTPRDFPRRAGDRQTPTAGQCARPPLPASRRCWFPPMHALTVPPSPVPHLVHDRDHAAHEAAPALLRGESEYYLISGSGRAGSRSARRDHQRSARRVGLHTEEVADRVGEEAEEMVAMANVVSDLLAPRVWHIGCFLVATSTYGTGLAQTLHTSLRALDAPNGAD